LLPADVSHQNDLTVIDRTHVKTIVPQLRKQAFRPNRAKKTCLLREPALQNRMLAVISFPRLQSDLVAPVLQDPYSFIKNLAWILSKHQGARVSPVIMTFPVLVSKVSLSIIEAS
jgi:hypothetical protein